MADLQSVIRTAHNGTASAYNSVADVIDYLAVLDMALSFEDNATELFSRLTTVLRGASDLAKKALEDLETANVSLYGELRL